MTLIISLFYLLFFIEKNIIDYILVLLLISTIILSQIFWRNPEKNNIIHTIDAIVAKIVILIFIIYTFLYKIKNKKILIKKILIQKIEYYKFIKIKIGI